MKKLNVMALLLGATLFVGVGSVSAMDKCGAGKCGGKKVEKPAMKCGAGKCGGKKVEKPAGKCGQEKKAEKPAMKCGQGKCGSK